jgi:hypothetical protein
MRCKVLYPDAKVKLDISNCEKIRRPQIVGIDKVVRTR